MRITIIGASGHGKVVADIAQLNGYDDIRFLDDDTSVTSCGAYPVVGTTADATAVDGDLFVAVGNTVVRKKLMEQFADKSFATLIHPSSVIADTASVGVGSVFMAGAVVNPYAVVGRGCIVNTCASVDHDCMVGDYVHVAVGAHICGTVTVGDSVWIGAGATVINNVSICSDSTVGAGAVVAKDIALAGTYVGVPARRLK